MKRTLISLLFLSFSFSASAQGWFNVQANCTVNRSAAQCSIYNRWYRPITCRVQASGQTYFGAQAYNDQIIIITPGFANGVSVFALNPLRDPLVRANASAVCRF
jgi:hypothetical protein